jgi:hypothetical protein
MIIQILGKKDDVKKMQQLSDSLKRACEESKVQADIKMTHNFSEVQGQSFNVAVTPIVFFNNQVEFTGMPDYKMIKNKIVQIRNMG